jgi:hypothetical protein
MARIKKRKAPSYDRPGRPLAIVPSDPRKVLRIAKAAETMKWRDVGAHLGISYQSAFLLHQRWEVWLRRIQRKQQKRRKSA